MEIVNIFTAEGKPLPGDGEQKHILTSGDRLRCFLYKRQPASNKDIMEGAHAHPSEAIYFLVSGELELNVDGETVIMKQGDAMLKPYNAVVGSKTISTTPSELLVVSCPDELVEKLKSS